MWNVIECAGHPRDLGFEQGLALRSAIRRRVEEAGLPARRGRRPRLAALTSGSVRGSGTGRETIRHFTHLAERVDGLARGADVPLDSLLALQATADREKGAAQALCVLDREAESGANMLRTLPASSWLVRRSRPEVGFISLEITEPWLVSALAGINEAGLAVCMVTADAATLSPAKEPARAGSASASYHLLVQECLQRFADVEAGMAWSMSRPAAGEGTILLADAGGHRGAVRFQGEHRQAHEAEAGPLIAGGPDASLETLRAWAAAQPADREPEDRSMGGEGTPALVRLSCARRQLELRDQAGQERLLRLGVV